MATLTNSSGTTYVRTLATMGTTVSMRVVGGGDTHARHAERTDVVDRAVAWFAHVESVCNRFDAASELRRLCATSGAPVAVSRTLLEAVQFALAAARASDGAFDPTVGAHMEARGFDRDYRTDAVARSNVATSHGTSFRDVSVDADTSTITLHRPLLLDLGAVAKGLAIDMAARELAPFADFSIDAGGDLYLGGRNQDGHDWSVGIRHPRDHDACIETIRVSDCAVCTSGDYARQVGGAHHLLQPRTGECTGETASVTVIAPSAMIADALSTAAFVLGPIDGIALLEQHELEGMLLSVTLERFTTAGWPNG